MPATRNARPPADAPAARGASGRAPQAGLPGEPGEPGQPRRAGQAGHGGRAGREPAAGPGAGPEDLDAVAALADPARRALYAYVAAQNRAVSREEAAGATCMKRPTAAFHLDKLVEDGLLEAGFARLSGKTGPGAGRTAKIYRRTRRQIEVCLPPRDYAIAGDILASAVENADRSGGSASEAVLQAAEQTGRRMAAAGADLAGLLTSAGYEPRESPDGGVELANCPFHALAARHSNLVCQMNLYLLRGILRELRLPGRPRLDPVPGGCCVRIGPPEPPAAA